MESLIVVEQSHLALKSRESLIVVQWSFCYKFKIVTETESIASEIIISLANEYKRSVVAELESEFR